MNMFEVSVPESPKYNQRYHYTKSREFLMDKIKAWSGPIRNGQTAEQLPTHATHFLGQYTSQCGARSMPVCKRANCLQLSCEVQLDTGLCWVLSNKKHAKFEVKFQTLLHIHSYTQKLLPLELDSGILLFWYSIVPVPPTNFLPKTLIHSYLPLIQVNA